MKSGSSPSSSPRLIESEAKEHGTSWLRRRRSALQVSSPKVLLGVGAPFSNLKGMGGSQLAAPYCATGSSTDPVPIMRTTRRLPLGFTSTTLHDAPCRSSWDRVGPLLSPIATPSHDWTSEIERVCRCGEACRTLNRDGRWP